jgi:glyoxylase-like metal-dependent hydrolase (beta-lactamase superfamily II)
MRTIVLGDVTIDRVVEAEGLGFPPEYLLPQADMAAIAAQGEWLEPHFFDPKSGRFIQSVHSFVLRTPRHTIVIDTCVGNHKARPSTKAWHMQGTPFLAKLAEAGVAPEAVDYVMCTHLHVDHVGWNTRLLDGRWVPTFPNAKYIFHSQEYDHWVAHGDYVTGGAGSSDAFFEDSVLPVVEAGQAEIVAGDFGLDDTVWLDPTPGHSPGHVCVRVAAGGRKAVFSGDLLHHPVQCRHPAWNSRFCWDLEMSAATRAHFVETHADEDVLVLPAHFAAPTVGRITGTAEGCRYTV